MKLLLCLLLMIFLCNNGYSEENIKFHHITTADGLSSNQVNNIMRDSRGFIWFSTSQGLTRYDGYSFKVFPGPSHNHNLTEGVHEVQEDATGLLWVRYYADVFRCYDPKKEVLHNAEDILSDKYGIRNKIFHIYVDRNKDLWLHNDTIGTYHYRFSDRSLSLPIKSADRQTFGKVVDFGEDSNGVIRVYERGYFDRIDKRRDKINYKNDHLVRFYDWHDWGYQIFADMDNDLWIWNQNGIKLFRSKEKKWETIDSGVESKYKLSGNHVKTIINDGDGRIWIAIDNGGINIIDKRLGTIQYLEHSEKDSNSLSQNSIYSLCSDSNGSIWAGTYKCGVSYYNNGLFKFQSDHFPEFINHPGFTPDINSMSEDKNGILYLGVDNGVVMIDPVTKKKIRVQWLTDTGNSFKHDVATGMTTTSDGRLWIGTYQNGLISYYHNTFTRHTLDSRNRDSSANKSVFSLATDRSGKLWIGTWGSGLWSMDATTGAFTEHADPKYKYSREQIASICISRDGNIYMATPYGMLIYNPRSDTFSKLLGNKRHDHNFSCFCLTQIIEDSRGLLWIATPKGLNIYDRRNEDIIIPDKLRRLQIYGIAEANDNTLWITTSDGVYHVIAHGNRDNNGYGFSIDKYCSMSMVDNQPLNLRTIIKASDGKILIGGVKGLCILNPEILKNNKPISKVVFTGLSLFNKEVMIDSVYNGNRILKQAIGYTERIHLNYDQNMISVTFSAMNYSPNQQPRYQYKLEGVDSDWISTDDNKLTYTNLSPGTYELMVKAIDVEGRTAGKPTKLKIVISPPFYHSWIAYILYAFSLGGIVFLAIKFLKHNEKQKYDLLKIKQEAQKRHEVDDMKLKFFTNISHDLRTPLTLILTPLEYVIEKVDNSEHKSKLTIAYKNARRLLDMVNQLLDFRKSDMTGHQLNASRGNIVETIKMLCDNFMEYSEHRNIHLTFFSPVDKLFMSFDEDKINKIVTNLLSNAFKFTSDGGRVDVSLDIGKNNDGVNECLIIKVADNGRGISDEHKDKVFQRFYQVPEGNNNTAAGNGIGLNLVKEFVELHHGSIDVYDNIGKGTVFVVKIPFEPGCEITSTREIANITDISCSDNNSVTVDSTRQNTSKASEQDSKPTILLVDDNEDFRIFLRDCLKDAYTVYDAPDGVKAWEITPELQPDIIISDVMMPEMDGNKLCSLVKNDIRTSHILVILLTARAAKEHEQKGLQVGADDYITKPFNLNILTLRIKNLLQRRKESHMSSMEIAPSKINITSLDQKLISKAIKYVEDNMDRTDLSVEELSGHLAMSRVHLYKKMMSIIGKPPVEFIRIIRLKRAAQLLAESQLSIAEIAYQTGFNSMNLFRKYFKAEFGVLPSEYQDKHSTRPDNQIL